MKRSDAVCALIGNALRSFGRMLAMFLIAREQGAGAAGAFAVATAIETVVVSSMGAMFASPCSVLAPRGNEAIRRYIIDTAERLQACGALAVLVLGMLASVLFVDNSALALLLVAHIGASIWCQGVRSSRSTAFESRSLIAWDLVISMGGIASVIASAWSTIDAASAFWVSQALTQLIVSVALRGRSLSPALSDRARRVVRADYMRTGRAMLSGSIALSLGSRAHPFVTGLMLGPVVLGIFAVANTFSAPIRMLGGALRGAMLPHYAAHGVSGVFGRFTTARVSLGVACVLMAFIAHAALSVFVVDLFFGNEYSASRALIAPLAIAAGVSCLGGQFSAVLQASGMTARVSVARWVVALAAPFMLVVGSSAGLWGVVIATVAIECVALVLIARIPRTHHAERAQRLSIVRSVPVAAPAAA